jgi:ubiquitin fusion degradation protein 1
MAFRHAARAPPSKNCSTEIASAATMFSGFGFGGGAFGAPMLQTFEDYFRCYPVAMMPDNIRKDDANYGGKIFLPPSALNKLTMLHIRYPMLFELVNEAAQRLTHSGVLEFVAEEGRVYLPQWMMTTLELAVGLLVKIGSCDVPLGQFVKIEPQLVDFLEILDPKAVLENVLRKFSTLTVNDIIEINYNDAIYGIKVLEVKPESASNGICVIETDLETDFAPPVGYVEPEYTPRATRGATPVVSRGAGAGSMAHLIEYAKLVAESAEVKFKGAGNKLNNKHVPPPEPPKVTIDDLDPNAAPVPLNLPENQLFFGFPVVLPTPEETSAAPAAAGSTEAFAGSGQSLRQSKKRKDKATGHTPLKNHSRSPDYIEID